MSQNIDELIKIIFQIKDKQQFKNYIDYIRFPSFKNLENNTKITFDFPLTIFVGQNGSGKSSALQAVYGCPGGYSIGNYWFSTELDPILNISRPSIIYSYNGMEVLKTRIRREFTMKYQGKGEEKEYKYLDPDYWEPARPKASFKMKVLSGKARNPTIDKEVIYLDFRSELSAFDKTFYFKEIRKSKKFPNIKFFLRNASKPVLLSINKFNNEKGKDYQENNKVFKVTEKTLNIISEILGKKYKSCLIIYHNYYRNFGNSIYFETQNLNYSEAFAGSGEFAVVRLVHEVLKAEKESLILLDEPEVSLHPGAQERLKLFLLEQIKLNRHQIVISTHSPTLIHGLPSIAIKVFYQTSTGKFHVDNERTPDEAFHFIGFPNPHKKTIYVEDRLAKLIVDSVLNQQDDAFKSIFEINIIPGGATSIKKHLSTYALNHHSNIYFYMDGDQQVDHFNIDELLDVQNNTTDLKKIIEKQSSFSFDKLNISLSRNESEDIKILKEYLKFYSLHIFYLPTSTPEELIWSDEILEREDISDEIKNRIKNFDNYKEKFQKLSLEIFGSDTSNECFYEQKKYVKRWVERKNSNYHIILNVLNTIRNYP